MKKEALQLKYFPLYKNMLWVAMKSVTEDLDESKLWGENAGTAILLNHSRPNIELNVSLAGVVKKNSVVFKQAAENPTRVTIHFWRHWNEDCLPKMAAGRLSEDQPFTALSLKPNENFSDGQDMFLNLCYLTPDKPEGFEALYLKVEIFSKKIRQTETKYLKITLKKEKDAEGNTVLTVKASEVSREGTPEHLQKVSFQETQSPKANENGLRKLLFK